MSPLEAVDGAQIALGTVRQAQLVEELAGSIAIPDFDSDFAERVRGCVALDEPEQFGDDGASEDAFCREKREDGTAVVVELEFKWPRRKDR